MGYCISLNATEILSAPQNALCIIFDLVIYLPTYLYTDWVYDRGCFYVARISDTFNLQTAFVLYIYFNVVLYVSQLYNSQCLYIMWVNVMVVNATRSHGGILCTIFMYIVWLHLHIYMLYVLTNFLLRKVRERHVQLNKNVVLYRLGLQKQRAYQIKNVWHAGRQTHSTNSADDYRETHNV